MTDTNQTAAQVLALARTGDLAAAIATGEAALNAGAGDAGLAMFVGILCCRQGDVARGIAHLRDAVGRAPGESAPKIELARALLSAGANVEAEEVSAPLAGMATPAGKEMQRTLAQALLRQGRSEEAVGLFTQLTDADGRDFESWDGLGVCRMMLGDGQGAITALRMATQLQPKGLRYWTNLSRAYSTALDFTAGATAARNAIALGNGDGGARLELARSLAGLGQIEAALEQAAIALAAAPDDAELASEVAGVAFTCKAFDLAEARYRAALAAQPDLRQAWLGLGVLLERLNRNTELLDMLDAAEATGVSPDDTALLRARALRGEKRLEEALDHAQRAPEYVATAVRAQLIGDIADRLGDTDTAFAAFSEANALLAADAIGSAKEAEAYRDKFRKLRDLLTEQWFQTWGPPAPPSARPAPMFIFGFPRSGTTLIDTMLSGHPDTVVLEEEAVIDTIAKALGPVERLARLSVADIEKLRGLYFAEVDKLVPDAAGRLIVDKSPLGLGNTALLHRLFPDARFVFAERHPCDVVLSCFITSVQMDAKVANFFDFVGTAMLYDRVLAHWQRCCEVLPIAVHTVRYERLIANTEAELRGLAEFAGLAWTPQLLANESNASARAYIGSPSYTQVAEPIYNRAMGRWLKYRDHMATVLPILAPWAERMEYDLGQPE